MKLKIKIKIDNLFFAVLFSGCNSSKGKPPNVLLIMVDDMQYSNLGCYGGDIEIPNLDKLVSDGLRFTQFNNCARCWPSRAALLSGYYPQQIGRNNALELIRGDCGERPFGAQLVLTHIKKTGYRSCHSGKSYIDGMSVENGYDGSCYLGD